jgi:hypothetical protein
VDDGFDFDKCDPDVDDVPDELRLQKGPLFVEAYDPDTGERFRQPIPIGQLGSAFADRRRRAERDDEA